MPLDCDKLLHPFQNDPGTSQKQRVMDALLSGPAQIDGRSMADLLQFFVKLAPNITYYDKNLDPGVWTPFFQKSLPFLLAGMTNFTTANIDGKLGLYGFLFRKRPSGSGLQLNLFYIWYNLIRQINDWSLQLAGSQLPIETTINKLITSKLKTPLLQYIGILNAAVKYYGVRKVDFSPLVNNPVWGLDTTDLYALDTAFKKAGPSQRKRLLALEKEASTLVPNFTAAFGVLASEAGGNIQASLTPLAAGLQQQHQPHLALVFVFLQLYLNLQSDMNGFRREHLDFFYMNVLQLKPQAAVPDKANLIVYLQNQVQSFALAPGTQIKDGKDNNKQDILFALDEAIAANVTQAIDIRTLFLNNQTAYDKTWMEGAYMAPDATMADGVSIAFTNPPINWPTLGARYSKYIPPGGDAGHGLQVYPEARIGFLLASNVLFLNEGTRTVTIKLSCALDPNACAAGEDYPDYVATTALYTAVQAVMQSSYVEITQALIQQVQQQGVDVVTCGDIWNHFLKDECHQSFCGNTNSYYQESVVIPWAEWQFWLSLLPVSAREIAVLDQFFLPIYPFTLNFSGAKQWIAPTSQTISLPAAALGAGGTFQVDIVATLTPDQAAVTFFNAKVLGEDFNTTDPVVKVELNDKIKVKLDATLQSALGLVPAGACCLDIKPDFCGAQISLYQFFRDVTIQNDTKIAVTVCGLKNLIVQNDDSLQNVNSAILPFGARPKVGSNFYIGCEEVFLKHWTDIYVNMNWKDYPSDPPVLVPPFYGPFNYYYNGYQDHFSTGDLNVVYDTNFQKEVAILQDGIWHQWNHATAFYKPPPAPPPPPPPSHSRLFYPRPAIPFCPATDLDYKWQYHISRISDFLPVGTGLADPTEKFGYLGLKRLDINTRQSFIRVTLECQDFQHDRYPGILARQMSALGKLPDYLDGAVYFGITAAGQYQTLDINSLFNDVIYASQLANNVTLNPTTLVNNANTLDGEFTLAGVAGGGTGVGQPITNVMWNAFEQQVNIPPPPPSGPHYNDMNGALQDIFLKLKNQEALIEAVLQKGVVIPNQPWTPTISNMSLDYQATADVTEFSLIHLYPFAGTYEPMQVTLNPPLFPVLCDEGTLFVGLEGLVPGSNVNFLFQLAEATANSEANTANVYYSYLAGNQWQPLRPGFEVLNDGTEGLTRTGILKLALPTDITDSNTVMPKDLFWIKAAVAQNVEGVSEAIVIRTQAISATFINTPASDQLRMGTPLPAGALSRLATADSHIKSIGQPYPGFGGVPPEQQGNYYLRVSELLRHKGRGIQKFDYERLVLQQFPVIFKAKCINHSFPLDGDRYKNDFPIAPGYVLLAVIPDLNQLMAGNSMQPKVPVSILEDIYTYIAGLISPFVRFRAMNPRYEKINFCITVRLLPDMDKNFFQQQLATDLSQFLAPWAVGQYDKLTFGQPIYRANVVGFIEELYYVDYIMDLQLFSEFEAAPPLIPHLVIYGRTPRSILIGGDIEVAALTPTCEYWGRTVCPNLPVLVRDCSKKEVAP
jgi:hypothetical protein